MVCGKSEITTSRRPGRRSEPARAEDSAGVATMRNKPNFARRAVGGHGPPYRIVEKWPEGRREPSSPGPGNVKRTQFTRVLTAPGNPKLEILNKVEMPMIETDQNAPNEPNLGGRPAIGDSRLRGQGM